MVLKVKGINLGLTLKSFMEIPTVAGWCVPIITTFYFYGWRLKIFRNWLVLIPDLNGTWKGILQTEWKNPETGETPGPIEAYLVIKQTLNSISCVQMTKESKSWSRSSAINIDSDNQLKTINFIYSNKPRISFHYRSKDHDGACSLEIISGPPKKLKGSYWTNRNTKGEMKFTFKSTSRREEFEDQ